MRRLLPAVLMTAACGTNESLVLDAAAEHFASDLPAPAGDAPISLIVDFAVENCPDFDPVKRTCTGKVPLAVRFVPLATTTITNYFWYFGDAPDYNTETAPNHVYAAPGVYHVTMVAMGTSGAVVTKTHADFIVAQANTVGDPCEDNAQCEPGTFCLCPPGAACTGGPARGMCTTECSATGLCGEGQVCAGLRTSTPQSPEPWQTSLCLPACTTDADCGAGLRCRPLPPGPAGISWVRGCFSEIPRDVGDPCMDGNGDRRDDLCASGMCADIGALGMCTATCQYDSCPPGSDCAMLGDGRKLCLRPCIGSYTCARDPLLTCVVPGSGDLGYRVPSGGGASSASVYCAPKPCTANDDCLPTGTCVVAAGGGHCVRR
ncbi:MAG: PKD domain-containing protein [Deltaproteobacteria bacterium]|nr:PKD domain-containing protein [Deltaproteobacteria bacterium]